MEVDQIFKSIFHFSKITFASLLCSPLTFTLTYIVFKHQIISYWKIYREKSISVSI